MEAGSGLHLGAAMPLGVSGDWEADAYILESLGVKACRAKIRHVCGHTSQVLARASGFSLTGAQAAEVEAKRMCPACRKLHQPTLGLIQAAHADHTGKSAPVGFGFLANRLAA